MMLSVPLGLNGLRFSAFAGAASNNTAKLHYLARWASQKSEVSKVNCGPINRRHGVRVQPCVEKPSLSSWTHISLMLRYPISLGGGCLFIPESFKKRHHPLPHVAVATAAAAATVALGDPLCPCGAAAQPVVMGCEGREGDSIHGVGPFDLWRVHTPWLGPWRRSLSHQTLLILDLKRTKLQVTQSLGGWYWLYICFVSILDVELTMQAAWTASDKFPASGSHQNTWHSNCCVPPSTITAKVWLSWPTPRKVRKRTWHSQKGSSPSCEQTIRGEMENKKGTRREPLRAWEGYLSLPKWQDAVGDMNDSWLPLISVCGVHDAFYCSI